MQWHYSMSHRFINLKSIKLNKIYKNISERLDCEFVDNGDLSVGVDGVHMDKEGHKNLAKYIKAKINRLF